MKFFVAKVDPAKIKFVDGRAALSPLRFHYDSDEFALPIRLGLANSSGTQDLIVNILAPGQRYQVANYKNVTIPTNLDVKASVKDKFGAFYAALFDRTIEKNPGAVVTEYAWQATTCDPCPGPALDYGDFQTLGADVLDGSQAKPAVYQGYDFVLTRLHARYGKTVGDDLRFSAAPPIAGGREHLTSGGVLEEGAVAAEQNNFQGRYAVRHAWTGPLTCENPRRGRWGGPPSYERRDYVGVKPALDLAFAPRGAVQLASTVLQDVPEIDLKLAAAPVVPVGGGAATAPVTDAKRKGGCGCASTSGEGAIGGGLVLALGLVAGRRRRRPRAL
jgi:MYXO-CTERM domain-containing protein